MLRMATKHSAPDFRPPAQCGVSLLEVAIVVALIAIVGAAAAPSFADPSDARRLDGAATRLAADLQFARSEAIARQRPLRLSVRAGTGATCWIEGSERRRRLGRPQRQRARDRPPPVHRPRRPCVFRRARARTWRDPERAARPWPRAGPAAQRTQPRRCRSAWKPSERGPSPSSSTTAPEPSSAAARLRRRPRRATSASRLSRPALPAPGCSSPGPSASRRLLPAAATPSTAVDCGHARIARRRLSRAARMLQRGEQDRALRASTAACTSTTSPSTRSAASAGVGVVARDRRPLHRLALRRHAARRRSLVGAHRDRRERLDDRQRRQRASRLPLRQRQRRRARSMRTSRLRASTWRSALHCSAAISSSCAAAIARVRAEPPHRAAPALSESGDDCTTTRLLRAPSPEPMREALALAAHAVGLCDPNPRVGCVIVAADGRVARPRPHAAGRRRRTPKSWRCATPPRAASTCAARPPTSRLEPCSHHGRTPPCCDALVAAGVGARRRRGARPEPARRRPGHRAAARRRHRRRRRAAARRGARTQHRLLLAHGARPAVAAPEGRGLARRPHRARQRRQPVDHRRGGARRRPRLAQARRRGADRRRHRARRRPAARRAAGRRRARQPLRVVVDSRLETPPRRAHPRRARARCSSTPRIADAERARRAARRAAPRSRCCRTPTARSTCAAMLRDLAARGINELHVEAGEQAQRLARARRPGRRVAGLHRAPACSAAAAAWPRSAPLADAGADAVALRFHRRRRASATTCGCCCVPRSLTPARRRGLAALRQSTPCSPASSPASADRRRRRRSAATRRSASASTIEAPPGYLDDVAARRQHRAQRRLHDA